MSNILIYRDQLLPKSEGFIPRHYISFKDYKPVFIGSRYTSFFPEEQYERIRVSENQFEGFLYKHFRFVTRKKKISEKKPQLIHAHFGRGGALALPLKKKLNIPLVVTFHGGDATKEKHYQKRLFGTIYQRRINELKKEADLFICVSDFIRNTLVRRGFPKSKLITHYIGIELPYRRQVIKPFAERKDVLFVGRMVDKKGVADLINAMAKVQRNNPDTGLTLIGEGANFEEYKELASKKLKKYDFRGWQTPEQVNQAMQEHLILAVPSKKAENGDSEGLPTVIMEAQRNGAVVCATNHAGIPEIIIHGETGFLSDENNSAALANNILAAINNQKNYAKIQHNALDRLYEKFNAATQSKELERIFDRVLKRG